MARVPVAVCLFLAMPIAVFSATNLVINEAMSNPSPYGSNRYGFTDSVEGFIVSDWIELYNPGDQAVNLSGLHLSDDCFFPAKWKIPPGAGLSVQPKGFLVIWLPGCYRGEYNCGTPEAPVTCCNPIDQDKAPFRLGSGGEWIGLYESDGATLIDGFVIPHLLPDSTYGCYPDGAKATHGFLENPTKGDGTVGAPNSPIVNLGPNIDVRSYRGIEADGSFSVIVGADRDVRVIATVEDLDDPDPLDASSNIQEVLLFWKLAEDVAFTIIQMAPEPHCEQGCDFVAIIPGQPDRSVVEFYIQAKDDQGAVSVAYANHVTNVTFKYPVGSGRGDFAPVIVINEILASNAGCPDYDRGEVQDPTAAFCTQGGRDTGVAPNERVEADDWVELYNATDASIPLAKLYLTNNELLPLQLPLALAEGHQPGKPAETAVQNGSLLAKRTLFVWADSEPGQNDAASFHAPFALDGGEDEVFLIAYEDTNTDGNPELFKVIDHVVWGPREGRTYGPWFGSQDADWSLGRYPDGGPNWGRMEPSPGSTPPHAGAANLPLGPYLKILSYSPVNPRPGQSVTFTARAWDNDPIPAGGVRLVYEAPFAMPAIPETTALMHDDGAGGDLIAGDGIYTVVIDNAGLTNKVYYHARVSDKNGNEMRFPVQDLPRGIVVFADPPADHLVISEVVAANRQCSCTGQLPAGCQLGGQDNFGDASDWIEISNPTAVPISLVDYYITDRSDWLTRMPLPNVILLPGERFIVWCDDEPREQPADPLAAGYHASFLLDADSDEVYLVKDADPFAGITPQVVDTAAFVHQVPDISYGADGTTGERGMLMEPTVRGPNAALAANAETIEPSDPAAILPGTQVVVHGRALDKTQRVFVVDPTDVEIVTIAPGVEVKLVGSWKWLDAVEATWQLSGQDLKVALPGDLAPGVHLLAVLSGFNPTWYDGGVPWTRIRFESTGGTPVPPVTGLACEVNDAKVAHASWTNGGAYDGIDVLIDGLLAPGSPIAGTATSFDSPALSDGDHALAIRPFVGQRRAVAATCTVRVGGAELFVRGDANQDHDINVADPIKILGYVFGKDPEYLCPDAYDVNDDGKVDVADPIYLLGYVFASKAPPPPPFDACGPDTKADTLGPCQYACPLP